MPRPTFSESTIGIIGMFEYYAMIYFAVTFWGEVVGWGGGRNTSFAPGAGTRPTLRRRKR